MRGLLVGRFQPFHAGHLEVVRGIRSARPDDGLIVCVGTAEQSYTWENPFTAGERVEMIDRALRAAHVDSVLVVPTADIHRHALWVRYLEGLLPAFDRVYTNNPLTRLLFEQARYRVESPPLVDRSRYEGARIRAAMADGGEWRSAVPPAVAEFLVQIDAPGRLKTVRAAPVSGAGERPR